MNVERWVWSALSLRHPFSKDALFWFDMAK